jgi:hypothetical protein
MKEETMKLKTLGENSWFWHLCALFFCVCWELRAVKNKWITQLGLGNGRQISVNYSTNVSFGLRSIYLSNGGFVRFKWLSIWMNCNKRVEMGGRAFVCTSFFKFIAQSHGATVLLRWDLFNLNSTGSC